MQERGAKRPSGRSRRVAGSRSRAPAPLPEGHRRSRFIRWTKSKAIAATVVVFAAVGAVITSLITGGLNQILDPNAQLDAIRGEPAVRVTVDPVNQLVYASEKKIVVDPEALYSDMDLFIRMGGVPANTMTLALGLEGRRQQTVRIVDIRPEIRARSRPLTGALLLSYDAGGSDVERIAFDLDDNRPVAHAISDETGEVDRRPYFADRTITLAEGEVVTATLDFSVRDAYVEFDILIEVVYGNQREQIIVTDKGRSFSLTACAEELNDYAVAYVSEPGPIIQIDRENPPPERLSFLATDALMCA